MDATGVAIAPVEALRDLANEQILDFVRHGDHIAVQRVILAQQQTELRALQTHAVQQQQDTDDLVHQITQSQACSQYLKTLVSALEARISHQIQQLQDQVRHLLEQVLVQQEFINSSSP